MGKNFAPQFFVCLFDYFAGDYRHCDTLFGGKRGILLDLACGTGTMTRIFTLRGYELIAVDGSEDMLMEAREKAQGLRERFGEFVKFFGARLSTLIIEVGGVAVMNEYMNINDRLGKFIVQFIVLVLNYIFSKFLVFKKR